MIATTSKAVTPKGTTLWRLVLLLPVAFALLAAASASPPPDHVTSSPAPAATTTSALTATAPDGRAVDLSRVPGWRVVYFWSAACPCVKACERYSFVPLAGKYRGRVSFFAVAAGGYDLGLPRQALARRVRAARLPYPVLLDPAHRVVRALGATVTPQCFVLDPAGRVAFHGMPDDSRRFLALDHPARGVAHTYLSAALAQALAGRLVAPAVSPLPEAGCVIAW